MQDFEKKRHAAAEKLFSEAFARGFAAGERALNGTRGTGDVRSPVYIEVPENDVVDGEYEGHAPRFEATGREVAMSSRRTSAPVLEHQLDGDPFREYLFNGKMLWIVVFK